MTEHVDRIMWRTTRDTHRLGCGDERLDAQPELLHGREARSLCGVLALFALLGSALLLLLLVKPPAGAPQAGPLPSGKAGDRRKERERKGDVRQLCGVKHTETVRERGHRDESVCMGGRHVATSPPPAPSPELSCTLSLACDAVLWEYGRPH